VVFPEERFSVMYDLTYNAYHTIVLLAMCFFPFFTSCMYLNFHPTVYSIYKKQREFHEKILRTGTGEVAKTNLRDSLRYKMTERNRIHNVSESKARERDEKKVLKTTLPVHCID
jgi:hypothetical protein